MEPAVILGSVAVIGAIAALWWAFTGERETVTIDRLKPHTTDMRTATMQLGIGERAIDPLVANLGRLVRRYTPSGRLEVIEQRLLRAGTPAGWTVERVLAAKGAGAVIGTVLGVLRLVSNPGSVALVLLLAFAAFGYFLPDILLRNKADKRQEEIQKSLSETVDQIVIVVEAGLGIDAALARVATTGHGPLADELSRAIQDTRAGIPRADALVALSERVPVAELRQFVVALVQAERLGVPVVQTLRVQAKELRVRRHQYAEEKAGKLPVKILFPTVLCVFPGLFIVLLTPALIDIFKIFGG